MSKPTIAILILIALAAGGYFWMQGQPAEPEAPMEAKEPVKEQPSEEETKMEEVAQEAAEKLEEASEEMKEAAEEAKEAVSDAVNEAEEAVQDKVEEAQEAVRDALKLDSEDAPAATEDAANAIDGTASAADSVGEATEAAASEATELPDALTVEGFNAEEASKLVDGAGLDQLKASALKALLTKAADNPELLEGTLEQVRKALGL